VFSDDRRAFEEGRFWFHDGMHFAEPMYPFDVVALDCAFVAFNQASARLFVVPSSLGVEYRILKRAELFARRGGYYYEHCGSSTQTGASGWRPPRKSSSPSRYQGCPNSRTSAS
jgi:hypothetical protein